jgi:hypothetical protein
MPDLYDLPIKTRFEHLHKVLSSRRFLQMQGLNNEIPFFIFPYKPQEQVEIEKMGKHLINKLGETGIIVLKVNLYDLAIEIMKKKQIWDVFINHEEEFSKQELLEDLQGSLNPENNIIPAIEEKVKESQFDILFITGVGEVFPYIRSHTILNNLQSKVKDRPTLMWFPGKYTYSDKDGSSLDLFGILHDDRYYRAFNILEYQL